MACRPGLRNHQHLLLRLQHAIETPPPNRSDQLLDIPPLLLHHPDRRPRGRRLSSTRSLRLRRVHQQYRLEAERDRYVFLLPSFSFPLSLPQSTEAYPSNIIRSIHSRPDKHKLRLRMPRLRHPPGGRTPQPLPRNPHRDPRHRSNRLRDSLDLLNRPLLLHQRSRRHLRYRNARPVARTVLSGYRQ